ncbi:MAG: hypothetical protein U1E65_35700 [Myxococcota bacterium]
MNGRVLRIVADILTSNAKLKAFQEDPEAAMKKAGLTEDERVLLYTCCRPLIAEAIRREIDAWETTAKEGSKFTKAAWPGPDPGIKQVSPLSAKSGSNITLVIEGEGILRNAEVRIVKGKQSLKVGKVTGSGGFRDTILRVPVSLKGAAKGKYEIQVINGENVLYSEPRDPWPSKAHDSRNAGLPPLVFNQSFTVT